MARPRKVDTVRPDYQNVTVAHKKPGYIAPPRGLSKVAKDVWETYWQDPVSNVAASVDSGLIIRWIQAVDLFEKLMRDFEKEMFFYDDKYRKTPNPAFSLAEQVHKRIQGYEAQLGIGPKNRINLGMTLASAARTLETISSDHEVPEGEKVDEITVRVDPRRASIPGRVEE